MRRTTTVLLLTVMAMAPCMVEAQPCTSCLGDIDGDDVVTIDEIVAGVNSALTGCGDAFFQDEFLGTQLNPERWRVSQNGFPSGVGVSKGVLQVGRPGTVAQDFPYIESLASPFPPSGDFQLDVRLQFPVTGINGSEFSLLGANGRSLLRIRSPLSEPTRIMVTVPGAVVAVDDYGPNYTYEFSIAFRDGRLDVALDGAPLIEAFPVDSRPSRIWIGYPSLGQFYGIDATSARPEGVRDSGVVFGRWWTSGFWSVIRIDSIRVTPLPTTGPTRASTQPCNACPGDHDGDGRVTIDEIIGGVYATINGCEDVLFQEQFLGGELNPERWRMSPNGFPAPGVVVSDGVLQLGRASETSLDFPYVESVGPIFPASGDIQLDVVAQFLSAGANASRISVAAADGTSVRLEYRQSDSSLTLANPGGISSLNGFAPTAPHKYSFVFRDGFMDSFIDNSPIASNLPFSSRPARIWIGQPSVGQFFGPPYGEDVGGGLDTAGTVTTRWWTQAPWSTIRVDSISVRHWPSRAN